MDGITEEMDMSLSKLRELKDREAWRATVHGVPKSRMQLSLSLHIFHLEKTLESPLGCKEIKPVHPKGNQSLIFTGRTDADAEAPTFWSPDTYR